MKRIFLVIALSVLVMSCSMQPAKIEMNAQSLVDSLTSIIKPIMKESALAYWNATASGEDQYYERYTELDIELTKIFSNPNTFKKLDQYKKARIKDVALARQIEVLYASFLANQTDPELLNQITKLSTEVEQRFNTFRSTVDGKQLSGNDIKKSCQTAQI